MKHERNTLARESLPIGRGIFIVLQLFLLSDFCFPAIGHVLLDPGHGGTDGGTTWCNIVEKSFVLTISNEAYTKIWNDANCPWYAYTTRHTDVYKTLDERVIMANNLNNDQYDSHNMRIPQGGVNFFSSIHANSVQNPPSTVSGTLLLYYELNGIENDRSRRSKNTAVLMLQLYVAATRPVFGSAKSNGIRHQNVQVLRETRMPAILIETEFLSNNSNCNTLNTSTYKTAAAEGIKQGACWVEEEAPYYVDIEMAGVSFISGIRTAYAGDCFVARNPTPFQTVTQYVSGTGTRQDLQNNSLGVVDDYVRVQARSGGFIQIGAQARVVLGRQAELVAGSGGVIEDGGGEFAFLSDGSCIGLQQGTLRLLDNAELRVGNEGILASFEPSTIELGNNAKIIIESNAKLIWNANSNLIMGGGSSIELYGTLSVADNVNFAIPSGTTVRFHPGAQINMGYSSSIAVNGTLTAIGTSQSPIAFRGNNGATWNGIVFQSGSSGEIAYANISNAQYGIQCDGALPSIHNNTISGNSIGLYLNNLGKHYGGPLIASNVIESNTYYGVYLYNSSPDLSGNTIRNNGYDGIYCDWYSAPVLSFNTVTGNQYTGLVCRFFSPAYLGAGPGWNRITGNNQGVLADYESHTWLYYNSVFGNTGYEVTAAYNSFVSATSNWWGAYPPDNGEFLASSGGSIDYSNALSWDPTGGGQQNVIGGGKSSPPSYSMLGDDEMSRALSLQLERRYADAIAIYDTVLQSGLRTAKARVALARMNECYAGARRRDFVQYLDGRIRPRLTRNEELMGRTIELENHWLVAEGQFARALANLNRIRREFSSNSAMVKHALFRPVIILLKHVRDIPRAQAAFTAFVASYPNDPLAQMGRVLLEIESQRSSGINKPSGDSPEKLAGVRSSIPTSFELHQNYPNPFNPTTTINFDLPEPSRVSLIVYDVLGRKVVELANDLYETGYHSAEWNASGVASGVYFARFTATDMNGGVKLNKVSKLILAK